MRPNDDAMVTKSRLLILHGQTAAAIELLEGAVQPGRARPDQQRKVRLLLGDAYRTCGDFTSALTAYREIDDPDGSPMDAAVAWRVGLIYHQQGEPGRALEAYGRATTTKTDAVDEAWLLTNSASAHWLLGDAGQALSQARAAATQAAIAADPQVRAAAHVAMALAVSLNGDPATVEEEYARAASCAAEAQDLVQLAKINATRSHHLLADARFAEAVEVAAAAGAAAEGFGCAHTLFLALVNEAEGLFRLGRHDEAVERCERALALGRQIGTRRTAYALVGLAQIRLRRGCREQARAALEQALRLQGDEPDRQVRVPALAQLAITMLPEEPVPASVIAAEALREATGSARLPALLAAGSTAWANGDIEAARSFATQAVEHARQRRERAWLAEALELRALSVGPGPARAALTEAHQIWHDAGAGHDADRVLVQLAGLAPGSATTRMAGRLALARLAAAGVLGSARAIEAHQTGRVHIVTFGRFEVFVDGAVVPAERWQSRRARELLRLLVCRRGRAVPRMEICEALWPDDDPDRTNHRLSVLLSILRGVLGADVVITDQACVALNSRRVQVDVEQFLAEIADAVTLHERGTDPDAARVLTEALDRYTDEAFADAPYDDVTTGLRDEARAAFQQGLRLMATVCRRAAESDKAAGYLRRLLDEDRYDEDAHRTLIAVLDRAGRRGQARLAAGRYRSAMAEIGLPPAV